MRKVEQSPTGRTLMTSDQQPGAGAVRQSTSSTSRLPTEGPLSALPTRNPRGPANKASASAGMQQVKWRDKVGDVPFKRVKLDEESDLGSGASGEVRRFHTDDPQTGSIAVKVYHDDENLDDEYNGLKKLQEDTGPHKGFISSYGLGYVPMPEGMRPGLLMKEMRADGAAVFNELNEMVERGEDLAKVNGAVQLVARRTTKAVNHANSKEMTIADIKPDNLLFDNDPKARSVIADLNTWADAENPSGGGTYDFMPPEIKSQESEQIGFEPKYDIYSTGVTLSTLSNPNDPLRADFIRQTTHHDPEQRLTTEQALAHPYLAKQTGEFKQQSIATLLRAVALARDEPDPAGSENP